MKVLKIIGWVVLGVVGVAALGLGLGYAVMWLWNWLLPPLLRVPTIGYWQAVGLFILCHLLFKSHVLGGQGDPDKAHRKKGNGHKFAQEVRSLVPDEECATGASPTSGT